MYKIIMCIMLGALLGCLILQIAANISLCFDEDKSDNKIRRKK